MNACRWTPIERITAHVYRYLWQLTTFRGHAAGVVIQMLVLFVAMASLVVVGEGAGERNDVLLG